MPRPTHLIVTSKSKDLLEGEIKPLVEQFLQQPSKKNVKTFLDDIRKTIKAARGWPAAELIDELNPKIRGWANYHRHVVSKRTFDRADHEIFSRLWRWARRRHPTKSPHWLKQKYFGPPQGRGRVLFWGNTRRRGRAHKGRVLHPPRTPPRP